MGLQFSNIPLHTQKGTNFKLKQKHFQNSTTLWADSYFACWKCKSSTGIFCAGIGLCSFLTAAAVVGTSNSNGASMWQIFPHFFLPQLPGSAPTRHHFMTFQGV